MAKTIICSHGFGVKADDNGLFPSLAAAFPDYDFAMFDYNQVLDNGDLIIATLPEQSQKLQTMIDEYGAGAVLLCHSQGSMIAGLVDLGNLSKVILLAPPAEGSMQLVMNRLIANPSSDVNLDGVSKLKRSDGTTSHVSGQFIHSALLQKPMELYTKIAGAIDTVIIRATNDEVIGLTNVDTIEPAQHVDIAADHNFTGSARAALISCLRLLL